MYKLKQHYYFHAEFLEEVRYVCTYRQKPSVEIGDDHDGDILIWTPVRHGAVDRIPTAGHTIYVAVLYNNL